MNLGWIKKVLPMAIAIIPLLPAAAHAQSAFTGVVKDASGAVLPGVTIEAASDALIEKSRSVVTDSDGGYRLIDLRPGTYSLTFSLEGFSTVKREGLQLPSNFVMTINADLKVGTLEETLTVTGAAPTVDVQTTTKSQVLNREALDAIPTGRTIQGMGQLITGVALNQPDVGGSKAMQQTYMSAHGAGSSQVTVQVDGLLVNGLDGDGAVQSYFNSSMSQEMVYTTSGASADVAGGGVRLNMIPRDGGNTLAGTLFTGYQNKSFQGNNITQDLIKRGLQTSDGIGKLTNTEGSLGGPIKKDKVWFFGSARVFLLDTLPADTFYGIPGTETPTSAPLPDMSKQAVDGQGIKSFQARITWQLSPKNKLTVYNDRLLKHRNSDMTAGVDPATASNVWKSPIYTTGSVKFSSTATSKILIESGFSTNYERYTIFAQPGLAKVPYSPAWYSQVSKVDYGLGTYWNFATFPEYGAYPDRFSASGSVSYVTGEHNIKVGIQDTWGRYRLTETINGDLQAEFFEGVPYAAYVFNTPFDNRTNLNADLGIYAQDSWTMKRLTLNYGARWEDFSSGIPLEKSGVGRFVSQARSFGPIDMPTWKSIAPRGGAVYDLFGNQKTALKFSMGRYEQAGTTGFAARYNPLSENGVDVSWTDLNGDGVPQGELGCVYLTRGCELNVSGNGTTPAELPADFGLANLPSFDPDIKRMYNVETTVSVQQEIRKGLSVSAGYYDRRYHNLWRRTNTGVTFADFTPFTAYSPIDGAPITYYNVSAAKTAALSTNLVDTNAPNRTDNYKGFEYNFNGRLPHGINVFGGGMVERIISNSCDDDWNPNLLLYCDQSKSGLPWRSQFKLAAAIPLPYGFQVGTAFQSLPGYRYGTASLGAESGVAGPSGSPSPTQLANPAGKGTVWLVTSSTTYTANSPCVAQGKCAAGQKVDPGITQSSLAIPILPPMTEYGDRINQLDVNVSKTLKFGGVSLEPRIDFYNLLNVAPVTAILGLNYGSSSYHQPSVVFNPRTIQIGALVKF